MSLVKIKVSPTIGTCSACWCSCESSRAPLSGQGIWNPMPPQFTEQNSRRSYLVKIKYKHQWVLLFISIWVGVIDTSSEAFRQNYHTTSGPFPPSSITSISSPPPPTTTTCFAEATQPLRWLSRLFSCENNVLIYLLMPKLYRVQLWLEKDPKKLTNVVILPAWILAGRTCTGTTEDVPFSDAPSDRPASKIRPRRNGMRTSLNWKTDISK